MEPWGGVDLSFNQSLADGYSSQSQVARVLSQDWVERQLYCPACLATDLEPTPENTHSRDFNCGTCSEPFELKSRSNPFQSRVLNGEYHTMLATIQESRTPNLLLLEYDRVAYAVRNLTVIHRNLLGQSAILARKSPLSDAARRRGWLGCYIDLSNIPSAGRIQLIHSGVLFPPELVHKTWRSFEFLGRMDPSTRGWLADVLACVDTLPGGTFALDDVYQFESRLQRLHPANSNVRPKIRQQLQVLVREGLIERTEPGMYRRLSVGPARSEGPRAEPSV